MQLLPGLYISHRIDVGMLDTLSLNHTHFDVLVRGVVNIGSISM